MSRTWKQNLMTVPAIGVSILPKLACPACWPAYATLLSSVGLGFLISTVYLLPVTIVMLSIALAALAFRAKQRRGYGPFLLGFAASTAVLLGKFVWESKPTMYSAFVLLVVASLWNAWPRTSTISTKQQCAPTAKLKKCDELKF